MTPGHVPSKFIIVSVGIFEMKMPLIDLHVVQELTISGWRSGQIASGKRVHANGPYTTPKMSVQNFRAITALP